MDETMNEPIQTAPFAPFEWMLSARYLRARRKEGFISVIAGFSFLGIMLGVATLIIVMAVMNGFRKELLDKILGLNGHILVQPLESPLTDWKDVAERISQVQGIRLAAPVVDGQALASSPFNASGVFVRGIRADDLNNLTSIAKNIKQGTLEGFDEGQGVAIGRRLADQLSIHAGDSVTLVSPKGAVTPMGTTPRIKPYKVTAVFEIGMSEYDSTFVFMPLPEAQAYFNRVNDVSAIEVFTTNPDRIEAFRKSVTEAAGRPVFLVDWRQRNSTFLNRRGRHAHRIHRRPPDLHEHRIDPAVPVLGHQHRAVRPDTVFPLQASGRNRLRRDHRGGDHGADAVVPRDIVSVVAGGAPRSRRSAPV
jgi:lipoprotein-releasing system permease protein